MKNFQNHFCKSPIVSYSSIYPSIHLVCLVLIDRSEMQMLKKGSTVLRDIEGLSFVAVIQDIYPHENCATIKYVDDGNIECDVSLDVLNLADSSSNSVSIVLKKDTLRKPLAGLVEDDSDTRNKHTPTVFLHCNDSLDEAIIMNGAENKQPAGGGLRALRHLRK